ncbi:MAG TPA: DNA-processing protein DprA [Hyphomicrobiaceae bacterium]|nr:DNA-processing protein DprA [Hyphomicrobiaceae bacterium]
MPKANPEPQTLFTAAPLPVATLNDAERLACLRLIRSENVGPVTFRELINHYGGAQQALEALPELAARGGNKRRIRITSKADGERELHRAAKAGAKPIFTIEPGYPPALASIEAPPPMLYVRGMSDLLTRPAVAIVGSRQASAAGHKLTRQFASGLGHTGYVVVSGLARGIDAIAHETALQTGTIAVVAGGVDIVYPPDNAALTEAIAERGAIVSDMPPGFQPRAKDFPRRNRIISGIALGVIVVEAAKRSGTLVTARLAGEQGREVFAVPGHPLDPRAEGTNALLKRGATLVTEPDDIIEALAPLSGLSPDAAFAEQHPAQAWQAPPPLPPPLLKDDDRSLVLEALGPAPVDVDALMRATGLDTRALNVILMELDLAGRIVRHGAGLVSRTQD